MTLTIFRLKDLSKQRYNFNEQDQMQKWLSVELD